MLLAPLAAASEARALVPLGFYDIDLTPDPAFVDEGEVLNVDAQIVGVGCASTWGGVDWGVTIEHGTSEPSDILSVFPTLVSFSDGATQVPITITVDDDFDVEGPETFDLVLTPSEPTVLCSAPVGTFDPNLSEYRITVEITDNDSAVSLVVKDVLVDEGDFGSPNAMIEVALLGGPPIEDVTVDWVTEDGTATTNDNDYLAAGGTVTFPLGSVSEKILVPVVGDTVPEPDEFFEVKIFNPSEGTIDDDRAQVLIRNDDGAIGAFVIDDVAVHEGDDDVAILTVTLDPQSLPREPPTAVVPITVQYSTEDGTAVANQDYLPAAGVLDFPAGVTERQIEIGLVNDNIQEAEEFFEVLLKLPTGAPIAKQLGKVTVSDDDEAGPVEPEIGIDDAEVEEGDEGSRTLSFEVHLDRGTTQTVSVSYQTADGTASAEEGDYQPAAGTLTFPPGVIRRTVEVTVFGDTRVEPDETLLLRLSAADGGTLGRAEATGTILDDDGGTVTPTLAVGDTTVTEGDSGTSPAIVEVTLTPAAETVVTVDYATADGSARVGFDYQGRDGTLTFQPGDTSMTVPIPIRGDTVAEETESFFVRLSGASGAEIADDEGEVTILDNDGDGPAIEIAILDTSVIEGDEGITLANFLVQLSAPSNGTVAADFGTVDGTAMAGVDYRANAGRVVFQPGQTSLTLTVEVLGDTQVEDDEFFAVELSRPEGGVLARATARCRIEDDDGGTPSTSIVRLVRSISTTEGGDSPVVVAERLGDATTPAAVVLVTVPGTARAGDDFQPIRRTLTWTAGRSGPIEVPLGIVDDNVEEQEERFFVTLREPRGAVLGTPREVAVVVVD
ncbi:MAG: hypothetical protein MI919_29610, partial [Holophagales bacterium]|nr:hypothetical protein [Holophagales bacterium]